MVKKGGKEKGDTSKEANPNEAVNKADIGSLEAKVIELEREKSQLEERITNLTARKAIVHDFDGESVKIGLISDTHMGSIYDNIGFLCSAYKEFKKGGITRVYHAGDIVDGQDNYPGQHYEQYAVGFDAQLENIIEKYPKEDGIETFFIEGNHSFKKTSGAIIGKAISNRRPDLIFVGVEEADILIGSKKKYIKLRLLHPSGGTAYAISYNSQKFAEAIESGTKPNILAIGHYHKAETLHNYRGIEIFQAGCIQRQTPFMRARKSPAMIGFRILDITIDKWGVNHIREEFFPWYDRSKVIDLRTEVTDLRTD